MIDYDKLKIAHELADKLAKQSKRAVYVQVNFFTYEEYPTKFFLSVMGVGIFDYDALDGVIDHLRRCVAPAKYTQDQTVYILSPTQINTIEEVTVKSYEYDEDDGYFYELYCKNDVWHEDSLYASKEELIKEQAKYWISLIHEYRPGFRGRRDTANKSEV